MKKIMTMVAAFACIATAYAQKGDFSAGAYFACATGDNLASYGIGAELRYNVADNWRVEPSFTYYLPKAGTTRMDASLNFHYLIPLSSVVSIYPLAGASYYMKKYDEENVLHINSNEFGANVGAGIDFNVSKGVTINLEGKYRTGKMDSLYGMAGLTFHF